MIINSYNKTNITVASCISETAFFGFSLLSQNNILSFYPSLSHKLSVSISYEVVSYMRDSTVSLLSNDDVIVMSIQYSRTQIICIIVYLQYLDLSLSHV